MAEPLLQIRDLTVAFPKLDRRVQALRGCSLSLDKGEILGLVGESGSGKSMTALACLGMVPPPGRVEGSITLDGQEIVGCPESELARVRGGLAAMIFQNPGKSLSPFFTTGRQMTDAIRCHRALDGEEARSVALEALQAVRMPDPAMAMDKYPHQMSGGQLQRVVIAMAMACEPRLLIADEPTTALDVTIQAQIIVLLRELAATRGWTILFITHDLGVVASLCDRVAVMYAGQVVETGQVEAVFDAPAHPYTRRLMETVPKLGQGKETLVHIPGQVPDMAAPPPGCAFHPRCHLASATCRESAPELRRQPGAADPTSHLVACHHPAEGALEPRHDTLGAKR
ncbi:MAG: ABC transporter ATP-binding protein [Rhodospirillales bacterium]